MRERTYAPYSQLAVGAAALVDDGRIVGGCNVENASYGLGLCAECGVISELYATGGGQLEAIVCIGRGDELVMPCGRCRQLLWEHGGPNLRVVTPEGIKTIEEILPLAFSAADLT